jgi:hypothetical protein
MSNVRITVEIADNTLIAHVVNAKGQRVYSSKPIPSERTFAEAMWPAGNWAHSNGFRVVK